MVQIRFISAVVPPPAHAGSLPYMGDPAGMAGPCPPCPPSLPYATLQAQSLRGRQQGGQGQGRQPHLPLAGLVLKADALKKYVQSTKTKVFNFLGSDRACAPPEAWAASLCPWPQPLFSHG